MLQVLLRVLKVDYELILKYFLDSDYEVEPCEYQGSDTITVTVDVDGKLVTLVHFCVDEFKELPLFFIRNPDSLGTLAHVQISPESTELGFICVNHLDSVSVNYERPELAFEESLRRHEKLLLSLIKDAEFNKSELLREFNTNWYKNTSGLLKSPPMTLFCAIGEVDFVQLEIYRPKFSDSAMSIQASFAGVAQETSDPCVTRYLSIKERQKHENSIGFFLSIKNINPIVPRGEKELKEWLLETLENLDLDIRAQVEKQVFPYRAKEFWLVLRAETPSGKTWVGMKLSSKKKAAFPTNIDKIANWHIKPFFVETFNKELILPRSGAITSLDSKKVLLVGSGSVGSEIAHKLGAAGVGRLHITDPDTFQTSNLYRHTLDRYMIDWPKATAVARQLLDKYPWIRVEGYRTSLLELRDPKIIGQYDLIVIAVGSPTHERIFHDFIAKSTVRVPTINCWLEGYGVGGHAILDVQKKKGCLKCAYVEPNTGVRGLASNLNFLQPDQNIVKNYAGCGEMFIPYNANSSAQTALIASNLAIDYLLGKLKSSTKVSWKGSSDDADNAGLKITDRYYNFNHSLVMQPLKHPLCDICNSKDTVLFTSRCGKRLWLPNEIYQELISYRQTERESLESAGLLMGCYKDNGDVLIERVTKPKDTDYRTRTSFQLDAKAHQAEIDDAYIASDRLVGYVGTWHTHPQSIPTPSAPDKIDWESHSKENSGRLLFFIIVGLQKTSVYLIENSRAIELSKSIEGE